MKYFKISNSNDIKTIGKYPQSVSPKIMGNLRDKGELGPLKDVILPEPALHNKTKLTSYIKIDHLNSLNFLVLKKSFLKFIIDNYLGEFQSWPLVIHQNNNIVEDYCLFHISQPSQSSIIDFKNSEFLIGRLGDWKDKSIRKPVSLDNYSQYDDLIKHLRKSEDRSQIRCDKLVFDFSKIRLNMFRLTNMPYMGAGYYVSEKLKDAIEKEGFTGMVFKEPEDVDKRIHAIY